MLSIRLFGPPRIELDGAPVTVNRRKSRALAFYLAASGRPVAREKVLGLLWPDLDRKDAQQNLRVALHGLRRLLGPALRSDDAALALDADVDARALDGLNAGEPDDPDAWSRALDACQGDFLEHVELPEAEDYEAWLLSERARYRRLVTRGYARLAALHERAGRLDDALGALDRALGLDALQEDLQREAMRLHYLAGDRAAAIRRYDALRRLLDEEMGVPPMTETRALYDKIIRDEPIARTAPAAEARRAPAPSVAQRAPDLPAELPFTGRGEELARLRELAARRPRALVLIEGEPGVGKTRLVEEFERGAGAIALRGAAYDIDRALPYQPIIDALRALTRRDDWPRLRARLRVSDVWMAEVARLVPELLPAPPPTGAADESRLWEGVHQFLAGLSAESDIALVLDDAQWADASTLALLGYLVRQPNAAAAFVATARAIEPRSPLASLVRTLTRDARLARLPLARLPADAVRAIASALSPAYARPLGDWLASTSEGNPYVLAELVRHARETGLLRAGGQVNLTELSRAPIVPQTIYTLAQARLERLSDEAGRVLDAAVAVGREFEFEVVRRAAGLSEAAALDAVDALRAAGLVEQINLAPRYRFDHSLTMEVAYREVGEARHRLLHRRVAEALEDIHRDDLDAFAGEIAAHFAEGGDAARAAPRAYQAGRRALRLAAWKEAVGFFELALTGESGAGRRLDILIALGDAHTQAGAFSAASEAFQRAIDLARDLKDAARMEQAQLRLGQSFLAHARFAEAIALARRLAHSPDPATVTEAEALWGTVLAIEGADLDAAAAHLEAAAARLAESGAPGVFRLGQITFERGSVAAQQGDLPKAMALYREALALAERSERDGRGEMAVVQRALALNNLAYHGLLSGDPAAEAYARQGLALVEEHGGLGWRTYLLSTLGEIRLAAGDLAAAERCFADGLALAERLSMPERIAGLTANLGLAALKRGDHALAIHRLSTALGQADALGTQHLAAQIRIWLAPLLPPAEARERLAEARAIAEAGGRRRLLAEVERAWGRLEGKAG